MKEQALNLLSRCLKTYYAIFIIAIVITIILVRNGIKNDRIIYLICAAGITIGLIIVFASQVRPLVLDVRNEDITVENVYYEHPNYSNSFMGDDVQITRETGERITLNTPPFPSREDFPSGEFNAIVYYGTNSQTVVIVKRN